MEQLNKAQTNGPDKKITIGPDGKMEKPEQTGTVRRSRLGHF